MSKIEQLSEQDITILAEKAREDVPDKKVIVWIIDHSPFWRDKGYTEIKKALEQAGVELA